MSRIFITGDTHGDIDFHKLSSIGFPIGSTLTKDDYVIICGDFGGLWSGDNRDNFMLNWYKSKPWTTLFIDGNHENFDLLNAYPVEKWNGGKVHKINDSVIHLMRGQVFTINGKKFFTMGGAASVDKWHRVEGRSWWKEEMPSRAECEEGLDNLEAHNNKVDYIISHSCSNEMLDYLSKGSFAHDDITGFLTIVTNTVDFKIHFFGHYHIDGNFGRYRALYQNVVEI